MDKILSKIMNSDNWPEISLPENLDLLNEIANSSYNEKTFSGMVAATMIYQQIIEAMCLHIIENCHFEIQLHIYPSTISFKIDKNKMLGFYLNMLESTIDFEGKTEFINKVKEFNNFRNKIVHEMRKDNIDSLTKELYDSKKYFDDIFDLYDQIQDEFRVMFRCFAKDKFTDYIDE